MLFYLFRFFIYIYKRFWLHVRHDSRTRFHKTQTTRIRIQIAQCTHIRTPTSADGEHKQKCVFGILLFVFRIEWTH